VWRCITCGRYGCNRFIDSCTCPLCTTPIEPTVLNLAQFFALPSHSRFSRRKVSRVVPTYIIDYETTRFDSANLE